MTETPHNPPPGYYPDSNGAQRYWDGNAWTEQTQAAGAPRHTASFAAPNASASSHRPWFKQKRIVIPAAVVALLVIGGIAGGSGGSDNEDDTAASSAETSATPKAADAEDAATEATKTPAKPKATKKAKPKLTAGQENALASAENYLDLTAFSREGLIRQLSSDAGDGYSVEDATYAADNVKVDYKEQAAKAAKNYLDLTSFSRSGLIQQLTSSAGDQYTQEEAEYGVDQAGL